MDALQKISDAPLTDCPECGASALKKKISAAAFRLKGSGWYETDFKKDGRKNVHDSGDKPGDKASSGDKKKGDGKPATKTDSTKKTLASDSGKSSSTSKPASNSKAA
jgi:putative FmdB family regulatory protein